MEQLKNIFEEINMEEVKEDFKKYDIVIKNKTLLQYKKDIIYIYTRYINISNYLTYGDEHEKTSIDYLKLNGIYYNNQYYNILDLVNNYNDNIKKLNDLFYKKHENCQYLKDRKEFLKTGYFMDGRWSLEDLKNNLIYQYVYKNNNFDEVKKDISRFDIRDSIDFLKNSDHFDKEYIKALEEDMEEYERKTELEKKKIFDGWDEPASIKVLYNIFYNNLRNNLIEEIKNDKKINDIKKYVDSVNNLDEKIKNITIVFKDGHEEAKNRKYEADRFDFLEIHINDIKAIKHGKKILKNF